MQAVKCQVRRHIPLTCKGKKYHYTVFQNDNYIIFAVEQLHVTIRHPSKPVKHTSHPMRFHVTDIFCLKLIEPHNVENKMISSG